MKTEIALPPLQLVRQVVRIQDLMNFYGIEKDMASKRLNDVRRGYNKPSTAPITITEFCEFFQVPEQSLITSIVNAQLKLKKDPNIF